LLDLLGREVLLDDLLVDVVLILLVDVPIEASVPSVQGHVASKLKLGLGDPVLLFEGSNLKPLNQIVLEILDSDWVFSHSWL